MGVLTQRILIVLCALCLTVLFISPMHKVTLAFFVAISFVPTLLFAEEVSCVIAESAIKDASVIRGLSIKRPVACVIHNRDQVTEYLMETIETEVTYEKLRNEEIAMKAMGFIPEEFNYEKGLVELYASQIGGYYDPKKQRYVMAGWLPQLLQTTVAVHELTHALQDQYYSLDKFLQQKELTTDIVLARSALVEGDATAVMYDYTRRLMGQPGIANESNVESLMLQNVVSASMVTSSSGVPQALQNMLIFPYTSGLRFAHHFLKNGGYKSLDALFERPPRSTEEVLHPAKYEMKEQDFVDLKDSDAITMSGLASAKVIHGDTYGEFSISVLLGSFLSDKGRAARAAAGWGGDRIVVVEDSAGKAVIWMIRWDNALDAEEFFEVYGESLKQRGVKERKEINPGEIRYLLSSGRQITLRKHGLNTIIVSRMS